MQSRKPWRRAESSQPFRPWNLQLLKAARERSSVTEPATPEPTTPITPPEPVQYATVHPSEAASVQSDTIPNAQPLLTPAPTPESITHPDPPTPAATPIDELPPWVHTPELRPRRDTVESTQSGGSNWGAGPLVNDWSQFESQMKNVKESSSTTTPSEISPSTSMDSTLKPLVIQHGSVSDAAISSPVHPSAWPQLDMPIQQTPSPPPARSRRPRQIQEDDDDDLEWVTNDTYVAEEDMQVSRRYSREQLFGLSDFASRSIGCDAASRIDHHIQMRRYAFGLTP
ncbi:hypothetical protein BJV82DRAFT_195811 [Fennellomyces sp. T-0311]|nr:hypothetical protein BJV82DRAFT_195811 [Fennellomyces sp. T-0311]